MKSQKRFLLFSMLFVFAVFSTGFLGFCESKGYKPCVIKITSPANGTVIPQGTAQLNISGKIVNGKNMPKQLFVNDQEVVFNKDTGAFQCNTPMDTSGDIFKSVSLKVVDTNQVVNKEIISVVVGNSETPDTKGVIDNAFRLQVSKSLFARVDKNCMDFINNFKNEIIYGSKDKSKKGMIPLNLVLLDIKPYKLLFVIDNTMPKTPGYLNVGDFVLNTDTSDNPDNEVKVKAHIDADTSVDPDNEEDLSFYFKGWFLLQNAGKTVLSLPVSYQLEGDADLLGTACKFDVKDDTVYAHLKFVPSLLFLNINETLKSIATIGFFTEAQQKTIMGLGNTVNNFIQAVFDKFTTNIPLSNLNNYAVDIAGVTFKAWNKNDSVITLSQGNLLLDIGFISILNKDPIRPALTKFLCDSTVPLPDIEMTDEDAFAFALREEVVNNLLFNVYQSGLLGTKEESDSLSKAASTVVPKGTATKVYFDSPPVVLFTEDTTSKNKAGLSRFARVVAKNIKVDLTSDSTLLPLALRASVDVDASFTVAIDSEKRIIQASIDPANSNCNVNILYNNLISIGSIGYPKMTKIISQETIKLVADIMNKYVKFNIPAKNLLGDDAMTIIDSVEAKNKSLIVKFKLTKQEE